MNPNTPQPVCVSTGGRNAATTGPAPQQLLVATVDGLHEFRRSSAAAPWQHNAQPMLAGQHPAAVAYDPRSGLLFAGLHFRGGVQVSADLGKTWSARNTGLTSGHIYSMAVQHVGDRTVLYVGTEPAMVFRSDDLGEHWTALPALLDVPETNEWWFPHGVPHAKNVAFHPAEPDTLYVCIEQGDLLKTVDGGKTWFPTFFDQPGDPFRRDMHRVVFRGSNPQQAFLTAGTGLYYSDDAGKNWKHLTDGTFTVGYPDPFFVHPTDVNTVFMIGAGKPPNPGWARTGTTQPGIVRSRDAGNTWTRIMAGMPDPVRGNIEAAALHHSEAGVELFAGTACGELFTSRNEGDAWTVVSNALPAISKGPHFRHFLPPEDRVRYEERLLEMGAYQKALRTVDPTKPEPRHRAGLPS
jgi:photosystem II stability/assembly factor-like uncharacterized protein